MKDHPAEPCVRRRMSIARKNSLIWLVPMSPLGSTFSVYRIIDSDSQKVLISAEKLDGFFVDSGQPESGMVRLVNVQQVDPVIRKTESAELQVLNSRQEKIGAYYLGRVRLLASVSGVQDGGGSATQYSFVGYTCEYPKAGEIWQRWASKEPLECGEWSRYPAEYHESWLHVSQTAWFTSHQRVSRLGNEESIFIDGGEMLAKHSFYCALGEAMNGPGGYFGSNLDALLDCLSSVREEALPLLHIEWDRFSISRENLGEEFIVAVTSALSSAGVRLTYG